MADPTKRAARADPEPWRHDKPEDSPENVSIVDLAQTGNYGAQHGRKTWIFYG